MRYLADWFNLYRKSTGFPLCCSCIEGEAVSFLRHERLLKPLRDNSSTVVLRVMLCDEHYITITGADENFLYVFDPYYWDIDYGDSRISRINGPFMANRKFPIDFLETTNGRYYTLNTVQNKIAVIFTKASIS